MKGKNKSCIIAIDAGGTMTDAFIVDDRGEFILGKALTVADAQWKSYRAAVEDAANFWGLSSRDIHPNTLASIYAGTGMLNTIITRRGKKLGLIITRGFEQTSIMERGLAWLGMSIDDQLHSFTHEHSAPLVDPQYIKSVPERIGSGSAYMHHTPGKVIIPLSEEEVKKAAEELLKAEVEAICILFLYSPYNPSHEERAAQIVQETYQKAGKNIPIFISSKVAPLVKECSRLKSLLVEAYAAETTREQLNEVEKVAKDDGYRHELLTTLSFGGVANIRHSRLHESMISGPIGGVLGGKFIGELKNIPNLICCDLGGTSFDVGIITGGIIGILKESDFAGHRFNLPMVTIDSIGAGAGMVIRVDHLKRVGLGPESAGAKVGVCYKFPYITLSDAHLALGYLNPDYFLGGAVKLDKEKSIKALEENLATPLGINVYDACEGVIELTNAKMREHIYAMLLTRGYDPNSYTLLVYGGAGPLHLWGMAEGQPYAAVLTVPWAAAFSAFGNAVAEYKHRYTRSIVAMVMTALGEQAKLSAGKTLSDTFRDLEDEAYKELEKEGFSKEKVSFRYGVFARYIGQLESFEAYVPVGRITSVEDMDRVIEAFNSSYGAIYPEAAKFPEVGYHFSEVFVEALVGKPTPVIPRMELKEKKPSKEAYKGDRDVYWKGKWEKFAIWEMDRLQAGNQVRGPGIIEHPMTTFVIPPKKCVEFDEHSLIWYKSM